MKSREKKDQILIWLNNNFKQYNIVLLVDVWKYNTNDLCNFRKYLKQRKVETCVKMINKTLLEYSLKLKINIKTQFISIFMNNEKDNLDIFLLLQKMNFDIKGIIISIESYCSEIFISEHDILFYKHVFMRGDKKIFFDLLFKYMTLFPKFSTQIEDFKQ